MAVAFAHHRLEELRRTPLSATFPVLPCPQVGAHAPQGKCIAAQRAPPAACADRMEASALRQSAALPALAGRSPLLRLQTDERLIALTRRGHHGAFEALVQRYQPRLLAFCRHMLGSQEDAEDVLQEVFTAAFNAMRADDRPINARPWLYRIARNRSLNHLRRPQPAGQDSMDVFERDGGISTADTVHKREEFRQIVVRRRRAARDPAHRAAPARDRRALVRPDRRGDGHDRAEREVAARARARVARRGRRGAAPHLRGGEARARPGGRGANPHDRAGAPPPQELRPLPHLPRPSCARRTARSPPSIRSGRSCSSRSCGSRRPEWVEPARLAPPRAAVPPPGAAAWPAWPMTAAGGITASGAVSAGVSTLASKAAAGVAAAVIVTAGAVEVRHVSERQVAPPAQAAVGAVARAGRSGPRGHAPKLKAPVHRAEAPAPAPEPAAVEPRRRAGRAGARAGGGGRAAAARTAGAGGRLDGYGAAARAGSGRARHSARRAHGAGRSAARASRAPADWRHASARAARGRARRHEHPAASSAPPSP